MINDKLNLKPCPLCGTQPTITLATESPYGNRIVIECPICGLTLDHTQDYLLTDRCDRKKNMTITEAVGVYNESATDLWNRRTPELWNDGTAFLDLMFPKCKNCKSRPSDYSKIMCMCSESMFLPQHPPRGQDMKFKIGQYEEMEE